MRLTRLHDALYARRQRGQKSLAVLLDPDNLDEAAGQRILDLTAAHAVDYFFVGGSLVTTQHQAALIRLLKSASEVPVVLFPSNSVHIDSQADAILLLSLISGRNPDFLIGQHVVAAPILRASTLEILPTGYMLVDTGRQTTASYMSGTTPLPYDKPGIAACTAMAGEQLGLRLMYLDGGSGAMYPVAPAMIRAVRQAVDVPIIVGGGINTAEKAHAALAAGADVIVVGNQIEKDPEFLGEAARVVHTFNSVLKAALN
ncbi:geranylgeranylglyceryl/heptaprenylglyceryl phosphate synthase [Hymenobacter busanensis]|uniref:Geranylgeranylglyceryl phosphate synthase n=1 Tax=Hymenobacter busanensis TaxID=2607656 RepID=A0A7L4ZY39_9BACT|nr:geranylgeranylglyceryl/heptaprenylglyceryl phosphate synthase [Hymenobacter busanensis]KAA9332907.1 geranylgeranylglyceryl/heptaprenylglyceryl phosphate synthase [Hymenobacter busanensis]QHJ08419.1 geranylgeranylglyceryl/heptaprenylglyceryl phosphate synthase [Hymenobacter busanensis]